jgi:hypothetical protein
MSLGSWFVFGFSVWCLGYFRSKIAAKTDMILISSPIWLLLLCGRPISRELPKGVLHAAGVYIQLTGWAMIIYGYIISEISDNPIGSILVIVISLLTSRIITAVIVRKYKYENTPQT